MLSRSLVTAGVATIGVLLLPRPALCETVSYAYDSLGRLSAVVDDRGAAATQTTIYWQDAASNRSRVVSVGATSSLIPVFRFEKQFARHFYTDTFMEGSRAGFTTEGYGFQLYRSGGAGTTAVYRCYVAGSDDHFLSVRSDCEGTTLEGLMGYVSTSSGAGLAALYRFDKASLNDHLITTNYQEGIDGGYTYEGTLGYVP